MAKRHGEPQFLTLAGETFVVLSRAAYDTLLECAENAEHYERMEDKLTAELVDRTSAAIERGEDVAIPATVWESIEAGEPPLRAIRSWRGLTQAQLAADAAVEQPYISQLESGGKRGGVDTWTKLARVLRVPVDVLVGEPSPI